MSVALMLEDFEPPLPQPDPEPTGPSEDYLHGLADGRAEAEAEFAERQGGMTADAVAALNDLGFAYHEARAHILNGLTGLFAAISHQLLPGLAQHSLAARLAQDLAQLGDIDAPVQITGPEALRDVVERATALPLTFTPDPALAAHELRWATPDRAGVVDLGPLIAQINDALTLTLQPEGRSQHA